MGTYDWMELQTLTNDIAAARARLAAARATKDIGKARGLEEEIARAESQRDRLLAHITTNLVAGPEPAAKGQEKNAKPIAGATAEPSLPAAAPENAPLEAAEAEAPPAAAVDAAAAPEEERQAPVDAAAEAAPAKVPAAAVAELEPSIEDALPETAEPIAATGAPPPIPAPQAASAEGDKNMWDQLKPSDIERAKQDLVTRREEMLARHAEELQGLEADQTQLDTLEQAIAAFLQKFNSPGGAGVVKLDAERELRQTAG
jgi:hypothetical protein